MALKWRRLWQPAHPLFWLVLLFNALSSGCAWLLHTLPLTPLPMALLTLAALGNVAFGLVVAWRLMQSR